MASSLKETLRWFVIGLSHSSLEILKRSSLMMRCLEMIGYFNSGRHCIAIRLMPCSGRYGLTSRPSHHPGSFEVASVNDHLTQRAAYFTGARLEQAMCY